MEILLIIINKYINILMILMILMILLVFDINLIN